MTCTPIKVSSKHAMLTIMNLQGLKTLTATIDHILDSYIKANNVTIPPMPVVQAAPAVSAAPVTPTVEVVTEAPAHPVFQTTGEEPVSEPAVEVIAEDPARIAAIQAEEAEVLAAQ